MFWCVLEQSWLELIHFQSSAVWWPSGLPIKLCIFWSKASCSFLCPADQHFVNPGLTGLVTYHILHILSLFWKVSLSQWYSTYFTLYFFVLLNIFLMRIQFHCSKVSVGYKAACFFPFIIIISVCLGLMLLWGAHALLVFSPSKTIVMIRMWMMM